MKLFVKIGLAIALVFSFAACGNSEKDKDEDLRLNDYGSQPKKEKVVPTAHGDRANTTW